MVRYVVAHGAGQEGPNRHILSRPIIHGNLKSRGKHDARKRMERFTTGPTTRHRHRNPPQSALANLRADSRRKHRPRTKPNRSLQHPAPNSKAPDPIPHPLDGRVLRLDRRRPPPARNLRPSPPALHRAPNNPLAPPPKTPPPLTLPLDLRLNIHDPNRPPRLRSPASPSLQPPNPRPKPRSPSFQRHNHLPTPLHQRTKHHHRRRRHDSLQLAPPTPIPLRPLRSNPAPNPPNPPTPPPRSRLGPARAKPPWRNPRLGDRRSDRGGIHRRFFRFQQRRQQTTTKKTPRSPPQHVPSPPTSDLARV